MKEKRASKKNVFRRIAVCLFLAFLPVMFTSCIITAALVLTDIIDETTEEQMDRIRDISGIEEYLITYDDWDFGADGHVYNDYEFYLSDGGFLKAGSLTELLKRYDFYGWCDPIVYAIGPVPMMKAVSNMTKEYDLKTLVSLNPIMVDGTGMCGACRVSVDKKIRFACVDGPEFDGHLVDWDELTSRLRAFKENEKIALEKYKEILNMECKCHKE